MHERSQERRAAGRPAKAVVINVDVLLAGHGVRPLQVSETCVTWALLSLGGWLRLHCLCYAVSIDNPGRTVYRTMMEVSWSKGHGGARAQCLGGSRQSLPGRDTSWMSRVRQALGKYKHLMPRQGSAIYILGT